MAVFILRENEVITLPCPFTRVCFATRLLRYAFVSFIVCATFVFRRRFVLRLLRYTFVLRLRFYNVCYTFVLQPFHV